MADEDEYNSFKMQYDIMNMSRDVSAKAKELWSFIEEMKEAEEERPKAGHGLSLSSTEIEEAEKIEAAREKVRETAEANRRPYGSVDYYTKLIIVSPSDAALFFSRALSYAKINQKQFAEEDCTITINLGIGSIYPHLFRSSLRQLKEDYQGAKEDLLEAYRIKPNDVIVLSEIAKMNAVYFDCIKTPDQSSVNFSDKLKEEGNNCISNSDYKTAMKKYSEAINLNPLNSIFYCNRALAYLKTGRDTEAEADCNAAIRLNPSYKKAYYRRSQARKATRDFAGAKRDLLKVSSLSPQDREVVKEIANVEAQMTESEKLEAEERKMEEDEHYADYVTARQYFDAKEYSIALNVLTHVIRSVDMPEAYLMRAKCYKELKMLELAEEDCGDAIKFSKKPVDAYTFRSEVRKLTGDLQGARLDLQEVIRLDPLNTAAKDALANIRDVIAKESTEKSFLKDLAKRMDRKEYSMFKLSSFITNKKPYKRSKKGLKRIKVKPTTKPVPAIIEKLVGRKLEVPGDDPEVDSDEEDDAEEVDIEEIVIPSKPTSYVEFQEGWTKLSLWPELQGDYIGSIKPKSFPVIFKDSLTVELLSDLIDRLLGLVKRMPRFDGHAHLAGLAKVGRFEAIKLFLTKKDKDNVESILEYSLGNNFCTKKSADVVRSLYNVKK